MCVSTTHTHTHSALTPCFVLTSFFDQHMFMCFSPKYVFFLHVGAEQSVDKGLGVRRGCRGGEKGMMGGGQGARVICRGRLAGCGCEFGGLRWG